MRLKGVYAYVPPCVWAWKTAMCYTMFLMSFAFMLRKAAAEKNQLHIAGLSSSLALHIFTSNSNRLAKVQPLPQQPCCAIFVVLSDWTPVSYATYVPLCH